VINSYSACKNIPYSYAKHKLISMFTKAHHQILSSATWLQYTPSFLFKIYFYSPPAPSALKSSIHLRFFLKTVQNISAIPCVCCISCASYTFLFSVLCFYSRNMYKEQLLKINIYHSNIYTVVGHLMIL
jgi:hypothetical protein